jgi:hypothetical protein
METRTATTCSFFLFRSFLILLGAGRVAVCEAGHFPGATGPVTA